MSQVLIIDDEPSVCRVLEEFMQELGHEAASAPSAEEGLRLLSETSPELVFLDIRLPGMDGLEALEKLLEKKPDLPVVMITGHGSMQTAVEAIKRGAFDHLLKPLDLDRLEEVVQRALQRSGVSREVESARGETLERFRLGNLVGQAPAMQEVFKKIGAVCRTDAPVLITGESGTGKELVARAVHYNSPRREAPFLPINCASIPETLIESEMFGHERGAFTGAEQAKPGLLEQADGGSVLLDEVGDLSASAQAKMLRFLEEKTFQRVGEIRERRVDVRILAATHEDLKDLVGKGRFREDLFYRLNVVCLSLPPLRERTEDLPVLTAYFLDQLGWGDRSVAEDVLESFKRYRWPGNVRELRNALQHAVSLCSGNHILPEHLPPSLRMREEGPAGRETEEALEDMLRFLSRTAAQEGKAYETLMEQWEKPLLKEAMRRGGDSQAQAARWLGITRNTLRKKLRRYGLIR